MLTHHCRQRIDCARVAEKFRLEIYSISMELNELGMSQWFSDQAKERCGPEQRIARVTAVDRGQCVIRNEEGETTAKATTKFMHAAESTMDMPCVGDWVCVAGLNSENSASIHSVLPRKSFLRRKSAGKSSTLQMIAANIDSVFIVQSCTRDFNVSRLERYLVMANEGRVEPVLVLSKTDLVSAEQLQQCIAAIRTVGITARIIALSNRTGAGLDQVRASIVTGRTCCLVGSSGVGKSTLINQLTGQDTVVTGSVSISGEGRHTTVRRHLIVLEQGGMIIDTPGMREVGVLVASEDMANNFDAIQALSRQCRFTNCSHTSEPGCAVLQAIQSGTLHQQHYQTYVKLKTESALQTITATDKRRIGRKS